MEIKQMKFFYKVAEYKSFTKAAMDLHVSQPTVTNCIHQLEAELKVPLFVRTKKNVCLTTEGELFLSKVKTILADIHLLIDEINHVDKNTQLSIQHSFILKDSQSLSLFLGAKKKFPHLHLSIAENGSALIHEYLLKNTADIGICIIPNDCNELCTIPLFEKEIVFCTSIDHPLRNSTSIRLSDLQDEKFVLLTNDFLGRSLINNACLKEGYLPYSMYVTSKIDQVKYLVKSNIASSFLIRDYLQNEPSICGIPLDPPLKVNIGIAWNKEKVLTPDTELFIEYLKNFLLEHSILSIPTTKPVLRKVGTE